jgi:GTP-binding protein
MKRPLHLEFLAAAVDVDKLPRSRSEVAFLGRSNVGKSSLLNALANKKQLAKVSNTPGRTQVLACFQLDGTDKTLVDCPGYGYAKAPKELRQSWLPMLERYLLDREALSMVMLLVDGEIGPTASDLHMIDWLRGHKLPHAIIATKLDKVKPSRRPARQLELAEGCQLPPADITWVSVHDNLGIDKLRTLVRDWLDDEA